MTTQSELMQQLARTAANLSGKKIRLQFIDRMPIKPGRQEIIFGYCIELMAGFCVIGIYPSRPAGAIFKTLLHEAGHARADGWVLDREAAADELAAAWLKGAPKVNNVTDLMKALKQLEGQNETCNSYTFTCGANAGLSIPSRAGGG